MTEHNISIVSENASEEAIEQIKRAIVSALDFEGVTQKCDICVMLTDNEGIRELNAEMRNVDKPTDVLSFPMLELQPGQAIEPSPLELDPETGAVLLGDIAISTEKAKSQAEEFGHSYERELSFLAVHSTLHLLGYDHEKSKEDEELHFSRQKEILEKMGCRR